MQNSIVNPFQDEAFIERKLNPHHAFRKTIVEGLRLSCLIGIFPEERIHPQPIEVNIELLVDEDRDVQAELSTVIRYDQIVDRVEAIASSGHIDLVETLAERILDYCETFRGVLSARVAIRKPNAIKNANSVGVELHRVYSDSLLKTCCFEISTSA